MSSSSCTNDQLIETSKDVCFLHQTSGESSVEQQQQQQQAQQQQTPPAESWNEKGHEAVTPSKDTATTSFTREDNMTMTVHTPPKRMLEKEDIGLLHDENIKDVLGTSDGILDIHELRGGRSNSMDIDLFSSCHSSVVMSNDAISFKEDEIDLSSCDSKDDASNSGFHGEEISSTNTSSKGGVNISDVTEALQGLNETVFQTPNTHEFHRSPNDLLQNDSLLEGLDSSTDPDPVRVILSDPMMSNRNRGNTDVVNTQQSSSRSADIQSLRLEGMNTSPGLRRFQRSTSLGQMLVDSSSPLFKPMQSNSSIRNMSDLEHDTVDDKNNQQVRMSPDRIIDSPGSSERLLETGGAVASRSDDIMEQCLFPNKLHLLQQLQDEHDASSPVRGTVVSTAKVTGKVLASTASTAAKVATSTATTAAKVATTGVKVAAGTVYLGGKMMVKPFRSSKRGDSLSHASEVSDDGGGGSDRTAMDRTCGHHHHLTSLGNSDQSQQMEEVSSHTAHSPISPPITSHNVEVDSSVSSSSQLDASVTTGAKGVEKANKYSFPVGSKDNKVPVHMRPKNSMSVKSHNKSKSSSDYHPVLLISTLTQVHDGPIWCSEFSPDGKYFATGGEDGVVQIWKVAPNSSESHSPAEPESKWRGMNDMRRSNHNRNSNDEKDPPAPPLSTANSSVPPRGTEIDLLSYEPIQRFTSHRRDVVDLSWSHSGYLLSASLDKTARLWHPTRDVCLSTFNHPDAITCVNFHPNHDRYFLTGGFDQKVRIWSIPNGRVEGFSQAPANISAATFDPKGDHIFAGLFTGKVMIYSVDDEMKMKYFTQTSCRNRNNKKTDNKVTGLMFLRGLSEDKVDDGTLNTGESDDAVTSKRWSKTKAMMGGLVGRNKKKKEAVKRKMLVTTNDSRLRLLGTDDFCVVRKYAYKGNHNSFLQIKARFSESGEYIISGTESKSCTIWNTATNHNPLKINVTGIKMYDKVKSCEHFEASKCRPSFVTDALFFPSASLKSAILSSGLFKTAHTANLNKIKHDFSSAAIITSDYEGTIRVFLRTSCLDDITRGGII